VKVRKSQNIINFFMCRYWSICDSRSLCCYYLQTYKK